VSPDALGQIKKRFRQILPALGIAVLLGEGGSVWAGDTQAISVPRETSQGFRGPLVRDSGLAELRGKGSGVARGQVPGDLEIPWPIAIILWDEGQGPNRKARTPVAGGENRQSPTLQVEGADPSESEKGTTR